MVGNFIDAKFRLRECITAKPNNLLKGSSLVVSLYIDNFQKMIGYAFNNLALACWWHKTGKFRLKNPNEMTEQALNDKRIEDFDYGYNIIEKDFQNSISLFKNAIFHIEDVENLPLGQKKSAFLSLLDMNNIIPTNYKEFVRNTLTTTSFYLH